MSEFKDAVYGYAYYFSGSREDAEDLTQEVLVKLWRGVRRLRQEPGITWVMKVTRNHCIDWARSRRKKARGSQLLDPEQLAFQGGGAITADPVQRSELRTRIVEAIARLPAKLRDLVILREIEEMKYEDIAETLGMPLNTVKANLHRGRRTLRRFLTPLYEKEFQRK